MGAFRPPHIRDTNSPDALCTRFSVENEATQERMHYIIQDTPGYGDDTVRFWCVGVFTIKVHVQESAAATPHLTTNIRRRIQHHP